MKPDNIPGNLLDPQSWNKYSYCGNNPVNRNDPTGHFTMISTIVNNIFGAVCGPSFGGQGKPSKSGTPSTATATGATASSNIWGQDFSLKTDQALQAASPQGSDTTSPWGTGWEWFTGGRASHSFVNGDPFTETLKEHSHIQALAQGVASGTLPSQGRYDYELKGWQGVPKYFRDYSTLLTGGLTGNLAVTYLGSYHLSYYASENTLNVHVWNYSNAASGFRPPVLGYTDWWKNNVGTRLNALFATGPMSQTRQDFFFTMPLP